MLGCRVHTPHSALFLLMLLLPLLSTGDFLYAYSDWENYHGLGIGPRSFHHHEDQNPKHFLYRRKSKQKPCQATPDMYFVLDKSESMSNNWLDIYKFVVDVVQRLSNQDLRVSLITYSCKGNIILPITGNREEILKGLERVKNSIPAGQENVYLGLWKANNQIRKVNSEGVQRPSMIIILLNSPLDKNTYKYSVDEANYSRKLGASVFGVGIGYSERYQIIGLAEKAENAFTNVKYEDLKNLIFPIASKACPSLKSVGSRIICVGVSQPVVLRGYGFDFALRKDEVICRFLVQEIKVTIEDVKAINVTKNTVTCPGPIVKSLGRVIYVQLSLDNGRNFLNNNVFVASKPCGTSIPTTRTTRRPTTTTTRTTTSTTTTTPPTTTTTSTTPLVPKPGIDRFIFVPILLALLLTMLLMGCLWQLCCLPEPVKKLPPPTPQPQPTEKMQPSPPVSPPAPAPPVIPSPIIIICCCTCQGLYLSSDMEGNMTICNFNPLNCHQLPLMWSQSGDQGWPIDLPLLKSLCAQHPCGLKALLQPSGECLPLPTCSQSHHLPAGCCRRASRPQLLTPPP